MIIYAKISGLLQGSKGALDPIRRSYILTDITYSNWHLPRKTSIYQYTHTKLPHSWRLGTYVGSMINSLPTLGKSPRPLGNRRTTYGTTNSTSASAPPPPSPGRDFPPSRWYQRLHKTLGTCIRVACNVKYFIQTPFILSRRHPIHHIHGPWGYISFLLLKINDILRVFGCNIYCSGKCKLKRNNISPANEYTTDPYFVPSGSVIPLYPHQMSVTCK